MCVALVERISVQSIYYNVSFGISFLWPTSPGMAFFGGEGGGAKVFTALRTRESNIERTVMNITLTLYKLLRGGGGGEIVTLQAREVCVCAVPKVLV